MTLFLIPATNAERELTHPYARHPQTVVQDGDLALNPACLPCHGPDDQSDARQDPVNRE